MGARVAIAACLIVVGNASGWGAGDAAAWNADRAKRLEAKLQHREAVVIVVLGDSLTYGMGVSDPAVNTFHRVFERVLAERYRDPRVCVVPSGVPGEASDGGLRRFQDDVVSREPDLVVLQYGGNDEGWGRSEEDYRTDLALLIDRVRDETDAACIVCAPPIIAVRPMSPFVAAAVEVGRVHGAVIADFDSAIRNGDADYRGPFPQRTHPDAFTHLIMAKELYRAFDELVGSTPALSVRIAGGVRLIEPGASVDIAVEVKNTSGQSQAGALTADWNGVLERHSFDLRPGAATTVHVRADAPQQLLGGKSVRSRLMAIAATEGQAAFDAKWVTFAPALDCVDAGARSRAAPSYRLGPACLTLGLDEWRGPDDLSAEFRVTRRGANVEVTVGVRDDDVSPQKLDQAPWGDAVEVYVDARPETDQAKPVYDERVFCLFVLPRTRGKGKTEWRALDAPAPGDNAIWATSERRTDGYLVTASIAWSLLRQLVGGDPSTVGFDVGVDDADGGEERKSQMMWAGTGYDYVDASMFAALRFAGDGRRMLRMSVR